ncbi:MAG: glycerophosphodiester phosphodiesterase family protein [Halioglobus sp.]|nr:glycerophosphodiester phosphodiesterase family protein [Halioglobus sp.]
MKRFLPAATIALAGVISGCSGGSDNAPESTSLTVVPTAAPEGAPGELRELALRVTLTEPSKRTIRVQYATRPGTATEGQDYLHAAGVVEIAPGELSGYIPVELLGDSDEEPGETFTVHIETAGPATPTATEITATIANDDTACDEPFEKVTNPWLVNGAEPLNFAHRGGVIDFPENTLFAYAEAALAGADVLEMDVYQTKDNELVVLHDRTVDRTTNGSGRVVELTLAELRALDAAYWFVPGVGTPHDRPEADYVYRGIATGHKPPPAGYSAEDFRIPTLEEALARFPQNLVNLELKPDDDVGNYEAQMAALLQRYGRFRDVIAASFDGDAARNFKRAAPCVYTSVPLDQGQDLVLGFLATGSQSFPDVPEHITWQVPPDTTSIGQLNFFLEIVTPEFVAASHAANLAVQVWTINSCEEMLRMIDLGVDAIMTDRPILLEELLATPPGQRSCP